MDYLREQIARKIKLAGKKCPRCESEEVWLSGYIVSPKFGRVQQFKCKKCGHVFR